MKKMLTIFFALTLWSTDSLAFAAGVDSFIEEQVELNHHSQGYASRYPIILHHGLFGFTRIAHLEYFFDIPKTLREIGYQVFVTRVNPIGSIKNRAEELASQIDTILKVAKVDKVNIVAHSMGGLDSRYLVSAMNYGDKVASISMISTPNRGSAIADIVGSIFNKSDELREKVLAVLGISNLRRKNLLGDVLAAIKDCSEKSMAVFNDSYLDNRAVYYQSWGGKATTRNDKEGQFIDPIFILPYWILKSRNGNNDGLVSVHSARWGNYRGAVAATHLDQVGFWWGQNASKFRHKVFFKKMAGGLARKGL